MKIRPGMVTLAAGPRADLSRGVHVRAGLRHVTLNLAQVPGSGAVTTETRIVCPSCHRPVRVIGFWAGRWGCRAKACIGWRSVSRARRGLAPTKRPATTESSRA